MKLEMTNGDSILLICWTDKLDEKKGNFEEKCLHLMVRKNHLFICDNGWNELLIKDIKYPIKKGSMRNAHKGIEGKLLKQKGRGYDKICIDLLSNEWCKFIKQHEPVREKKHKGKQ